MLCKLLRKARLEAEGRYLCVRENNECPQYGAHVGSAASRPPDAVAMETEAESAVLVEVERGPSNSRRLYAGVDIAAPWTAVWAALTDYDGLDSFIPGKQSRGSHTILDYTWKLFPNTIHPQALRERTAQSEMYPREGLRRSQ